MVTCKAFLCYCYFTFVHGLHVAYGEQEVITEEPQLWVCAWWAVTMGWKHNCGPGPSPAPAWHGPALLQGAAGQFITADSSGLWHQLGIRASLIAQLVKNSLAMQETLVRLLVRKTPWRRNRLPLQYSGMENSLGSPRIGHD